jgi:hypothetical protein
MRGVRVLDNDWASAIREAMRLKGEPPEGAAVVFISPDVEETEEAATSSDGPVFVQRFLFHPFAFNKNLGVRDFGILGKIIAILFEAGVVFKAVPVFKVNCEDNGNRSGIKTQNKEQQTR